MIDFHTHRLLCMMIMNDNLAHALGLPDNAFWVGFVLKERESGLIHAKYRLKYPDGTKNWYELKPSPVYTLEGLVQALLDALAAMVRSISQIQDVDLSAKETAASCYYPPDDEGDVDATLAWLLEEDLVEVKVEGQAYGAIGVPN